MALNSWFTYTSGNYAIQKSHVPYLWTRASSWQLPWLRCCLAFLTDCGFLSSEPKLSMVQCGAAHEAELTVEEAVDAVDTGRWRKNRV